MGIDLLQESLPDATTPLLFRRLLETHQLTQAVFAQINAGLTEQVLLLKGGSMVNATLMFVSHPFDVVKNLFKYRGARYWGLVKNTAQLYLLFGLANLMMAKKALLMSAWDQPVRSA